MHHLIHRTAIPDLIIAACFTTRAFVPEMLKRCSGMIVNITSAAAYATWPGATTYTAAR